MYKKHICFMVDLYYIYIKPHGVKSKDWYTGSYRIVQADIEEIIKEWPKEWKNPDINLSESDEDSDKEKAKTKDKFVKDKEKGKQPKSVKRPA